jgi:hypothetical protein
MGQRVREVQLGKHTYTVVAQRHAYLERKLGSEIGSVLALAGGDASNLVASGSVGYHGVLSVFVPELMPLHEWRGYPSQKAYEETELWKSSGGEEGSDQYDEDADTSPDLDQMVDAFQAVAEVNRIDLIGKLKELAGPDFFASDLWRAVKARGEIELMKQLTKLPSGESDSESLPPRSGASAPTSGGAPSPTPASSGDGPSRASSTT